CWAGQGNGFGGRGHGAKSFGASGDSVCSDLRSRFDRVSGPVHSRDHFLEGEVDARLRLGRALTPTPSNWGESTNGRTLTFDVATDFGNVPLGESTIESAQQDLKSFPQTLGLWVLAEIQLAPSSFDRTKSKGLGNGTQALICLRTVTNR